MPRYKLSPEERAAEKERKENLRKLMQGIDVKNFDRTFRNSIQRNIELCSLICITAPCASTGKCGFCIFLARNRKNHLRILWQDSQIRQVFVYRQ